MSKDSEQHGLPINEENLRRLTESVARMQEQARQALEANRPRLKAASESFAAAARGKR